MIRLKIIVLGIVVAICGSAIAQDTLTIRQIQQVLPRQDSSLYAGQTIVTGGVVTAGTGTFDYPYDFYLEDPGGGPFSGILAIFHTGSNLPVIAAGDSVLFMGTIHETTDRNHVTTIYLYRDSLHIRSHNLPQPTPEIIGGSIIDTSRVIDSLFERYESVFSQINNVTIDSILDNYYYFYWLCHDPTGSFLLRADSDSLPSSFRPIRGIVFQSVQGIVHSLGTKNYIRPINIFSFALPNNAPIITNPIILPSNPTGIDIISGEADFYDNGNIAQARLNYRLNQGEWITIPMNYQNAYRYTAQIGRFPNPSQIDCYFEAIDNEGNIGKEPMNAPDSFYTVRVVMDDRCHYIPGDVNANGIVNAVDVVCAIAFIEGQPYPPPYPCDCQPPRLFFPAGDANGSCAFNGVDISYFINFFKGGPGPIRYCLDCPSIWP